jgi:uncharacterized membrane protein YdjX (TVP38/TMEM64 family)
MNVSLKKFDLWKPIVLSIVIIFIFILSVYFGFGEKLTQLQEWIHSFGNYSILVFLVVYLGAVVAAFPGTALGVIAGALFGTVTGVILISFASTLGSAITFLLARYFARDSITRWITKYETFQRLDKLTEKHGVIIVAIARLVPFFPFNILNYGFGLTKISFRTYLFWSWLCMLPGTIVVVGTADAVAHSVTEGAVPWNLVGIVAAALIVVIILGFYARRFLKEKR